MPPKSTPVITSLVKALNDYLASPDPTALRRRLLEILLILETQTKEDQEA